LAVPANSLENIREGQLCDMTKLLPAIPMKNRMADSPVALFTNPSIAVGILATTSTTAMGIRAPCASQTGPITIRRRMAVTSLTMDDVQTCCLVRFNVVAISFRRGAGVIHTVNARKKEIHAQCRARMCGLAQQHNFISRPRSPSSCATRTAYRSYLEFGLARYGSRSQSMSASRLLMPPPLLSLLRSSSSFSFEAVVLLAKLCR
jgi:hypothetical protein